MFGIFYCSEPSCHWSEKKIFDPLVIERCRICGKPVKYLPLAAIIAWEEDLKQLEFAKNLKDAMATPAPTVPTVAMVSAMTRSAIDIIMDSPEIRTQIAAGVAELIRKVTKK